MAKRTIPPESHSAQEKFLSFRQLKVRKGYYYYQYGDFQPRHRYSACEPVPWVQIKGYWLNQAGFTVGSELLVEVREGCIVLTTKHN